MDLTPTKEENKWEESPPISPVMYKTPLKHCKIRQGNSSLYQNTVGSFSVLSNHMTPPSGLTKFIARNPFDAELTNRLHLSVISPTIFSKVSPKSQDSPFAWTIDELARVKPVTIEEFPTQQTNSPDPEVEKKAQEAINTFFSQNSIHPSPWNEKRDPMKPLIFETPTRKIDRSIINNDSFKSTKDSWAQTVLSLPPILPKELEEALAPFCTFTRDQNTDDDANLSNNSLRRKLFFCNNESSEEDDDDDSIILSPIKDDSSPPQSGMFAHGTPITKGMLNLKRTYGTPQKQSEDLSPPNISPICNTSGDISCQSIKSRRSATRLDFSSHMSVDNSLDVESNAKLSREGSRDTSDCGIDLGYQMKEKSNETIEMVSLLHETVPDKDLNEKNCGIMEKLKDAVDWYKSVSNENDKRNEQKNITLIRYSEQSYTSVNNHDTGYQTCSMNNTTANLNNRSITPLKKIYDWNDRINGVNKIDESHTEVLDNWEENIENMISSTPSRHTRNKDFKLL